MTTTFDEARSYPGLDPEHFWRRGYTVVRRLFAPEEVEALREPTARAIDALQQRGLVLTESGPEGDARLGRCDVLSIPELRHVLFDQRLIHTVAKLLGDRPTYWGESVVRIGRQGARAWHRDCVDRTKRRGGLDWYDPYRILRCGIYMQDLARHSGGLAVRPRSNRPGRQVRALPVYVDAEIGDLIVWDLRTIHAGEVVRLRPAPRVALPPALQTRAPAALRVGDERERMVIFATFGIRGPHLDHYLTYMRARKDARDLYALSRFGPEVWEQAAQAGLDMLAALPEYGTPPPAALVDPPA